MDWVLPHSYVVLACIFIGYLVKPFLPNRHPGEVASGGASVLVVDPAPLYRHGLAHMLADHPSVSWARRCSSVSAVLEACEANPPDVALIDLDLPLAGCVKLVDSVSRGFSSTRILVMSERADHLLLPVVLQRGAHGIVIKSVPFDVLVDVLGLVAGGQAYISPVVRKYLESQNVGGGGRKASSLLVRLTPREREVALRLVEGHTCHRIAKDLFVSVKTADSHRRNVLKKLGLRNVADLARLAVYEGLASPCFDVC